MASNNEDKNIEVDTQKDDAFVVPQFANLNLAGPSTEVSANQVKLQDFWASDPVTWFIVTEIQFNLERVTDRNRYLATLRALPPNVCRSIGDFLLNPPQTDLYESLKKALLEVLAPSEERKLESLLSSHAVEDGRPSEILRSIRSLASGNFSDHIIRSLWVRRLPPIIKTAIVGQPPSVSLDELKKQADRLFEYLTPEQQLVSSISDTRPRSSTPNRSNHGQSHPKSKRNVNELSLQERITKIEATIEKYFSGNNTNRNQKRDFSNRRSRSVTPTRFNKGRRTHYDGICFYHHFFKTRAHDCIKPCKYENAKSETSDNKKN